MHKYLILLICLTICCFQKVAAQETEKKKKWNYEINVGYLSSKIKNDNYLKDEALKTQNEANLSAQVHFLYPLSKSAFFLTGLNYIKYSALSESNGNYKAFSMKTDADGFSYFPMVETSFKDHRKIINLSVPIGLKKCFAQSDESMGFMEVGFLANYFVVSQITGEGTYKKEGLYPDGTYSNVYHIIDNIPRLGYINYQNDEVRNIKTKQFNFNYFLSLGFSITASDYTELSFKGFFTSSIGDIIQSNERNKAYTEVAGDSDPYKKTTLSALGIILGIKF